MTSRRLRTSTILPNAGGNKFLMDYVIDNFVKTGISS